MIYGGGCGKIRPLLNRGRLYFKTSSPLLLVRGDTDLGEGNYKEEQKLELYKTAIRMYFFIIAFTTMSLYSILELKSHCEKKIHARNLCKWEILFG